MIQWKEKFSQEAWSQTSHQVLVVGLLDSPGYDPTERSTLLVLETFGMVDPVLSTGWDSKHEMAFSPSSKPRYQKVPGLSGNYDELKTYPLCYVRLGEDTNGDYSEIDSLLIPIRKIEYWAEITGEMIGALDWIKLDWSKSRSESPDAFYPESRHNGVWIGKLTSGDIVLNLEPDEDGEQWFYRNESNVAKVYGIDSHTDYRNSRLASVAFVEYPQSKADRVSFAA
jgi:hypothetical protein